MSTNVAPVRLLTLAVASLLMTLLLAGCGDSTADTSTPDTSSANPDAGSGDQEDDVIQTGDIDEAVAGYEAVLERARTAVDDALGSQQWQVKKPSAPGARCEGTDAYFEYTPISQTEDLGIGDADEIRTALAPVLADAEFGELEEWARTGSSAEHRAVDPREATFFLTMSSERVSLQIQSGCYLDE